MHVLEKLLAKTITNALTRKAVTDCAIWSETYRIMGKPFPGPWSFKHHPWLREMHNCKTEEMIGQKAAQMGFTECALNKTLYAIDVLQESVLYLLPASKPDAKDFSSSRFEPALELSHHLSKLFSDTQNVGHKRAGSANLYIRGTKSRSQVKSLPVAKIIADEVDEMDQDNLKLARDRVSGQVEKQIFYLSTPTIFNHGINYYYRLSTKEHFFFPCPACGRQIQLIFPESMVITAESENDVRIRDTHLICYECKAKLEHANKPIFLAGGKWVAEEPNALARGFHIPQLYSCTAQPYELARQYLRGQRDQAEEQELYNSKLGLTFEAKGARVTDADIERSIKNYRMPEFANQGRIITMGVDVGTWIHVEIDEWFLDINANHTRDINLLATPRVLVATKVKEFNELDTLFKKYNVTFCIIDQQPEARMTREFAHRHVRVRRCTYDHNMAAKTLTDNEEEFRVNCNRTSWLDLSLGRIKSGHIHFPVDLPQEYKDHVKAPVRVIQKDPHGNPVAKYLTADSEHDHYAHARNYAEIGLQFAVSLYRSEDINGIY